MNKKLLYIVALIISLLPLAYLLVIYGSLPQVVPTHFGMDGQPDDHGQKDGLFVGIGALAAVGYGVFLLLLNLHKIDPKKLRNSPMLLAKIGFAVVLIISALGFLIADSARTGSLRFDNIMLPVMGLFFAFLGNMFYSLKPNYFVGIRTPWALEDENNWRRTHQLAARLWFAGGLIIAILSILLPFNLGYIFFIAITIIMVVIPLVYSFLIFRKTKKQLS